jgi:hypothetical protein
MPDPTPLQPLLDAIAAVIDVLDKAPSEWTDSDIATIQTLKTENQGIVRNCMSLFAVKQDE